MAAAAAGFPLLKTTGGRQSGQPLSLKRSHLNGLGECLTANVGPLLRWAEANKEQIKSAQSAYDGRMADAV